jgi:hypothetical protein
LPHAELDEVKHSLERHATVIAMTFLFYSNVVLGKWISDNMRKLDLERFRVMATDFRIVDPRGRTCKSMNELDAVFVVRMACATIFLS